MVHRASEKSQPTHSRTAAGKMNTDEVSAQAKRIPDYEPNKYDTYDGVDVAEMTVDTETCRIHVKRVLAVHDCGHPMKPAQVINQINGAAGHLVPLFEHRLLDR